MNCARSALVSVFVVVMVCPFSLLFWVASADATLPIGEIGVCKPQEENAERGINGGDPPLRGGSRLCRESPILFLRRAEGLAPKQLAASAAS